MSRLDLAAERFAAALQTLEKAAEMAGKSDREAFESDARLAAMEDERQALLSRIAVLEDELAALTGITQEVEGRLDGAIGEIRAALARQ